MAAPLSESRFHTDTKGPVVSFVDRTG